MSKPVDLDDVMDVSVIAEALKAWRASP
jgi:hypothetical protein